MSTRQLIGQIQDTEADLRDQLRNLLDENARLSSALQRAVDAGNEQRNELREIQQSIVPLQRQLSPLYNALKGVFGELERISVETDVSHGEPVPDSKRKVWESWKHKLGGKAAEFIDALLLHGEMTNTQLGIATGTSRKQTIYDTVSKLNRAGLLNKNGDKFSLKQL